MKKVLIVTRVFPPMAAVGVYRVIKFCKYLPDHGWQPVVLTVKSGFNYTYDEALLRDLHPDLAVYRSTNPELFLRWDRWRSRGGSTAAAASPQPDARPKVQDSPPNTGLGKPGGKQALMLALATPDNDIFWIPYAVMSGLRALRREKIAAILTTSPPPSTHLVGTWLSSLTGLPHVVDFRDLWTQGPRYHLIPRPTLARSYDRWLEKRVLGHAQRVVAATETFVQQLRQMNPQLDPTKFTAILNGLDPDDFADLQYPTHKNDKYTILHLGSLYGLRDPTFFFEVLDRLLARHPELRDKLTVRFIGNVPEHEGRLRGTPLEDVVDFLGHRPHHSVLSELWAADLLLLILGFGESESGTIPAKLFEYVATGRPILAFTPPGEAQTLINRFQQGHAITEPDHEAAIGVIVDGLAAWEERSDPLDSSLRIPPEFDRRFQAQQLAEILDKCGKS